MKVMYRFFFWNLWGAPQTTATPCCQRLTMEKRNQRPFGQSAGQCRSQVKDTNVIVGLKGSAAFFSHHSGHFAGAGSLLQLTLVSLHAFIGSQFLRQHQAFLARSARSLIPISPVPFPLQRRKNQRENLANFSRRKSTAIAMSASGEAPTSRSMVRKPSKPAACNAGR